MSNKKLLRACVQINGEKVWISAHTKKQLQQKKTAARRHLRDGIQQQKDVTFIQLLNTWFQDVKKPHIKTPSTEATYKNIINNHIKPYIDQRQLVKAVTRSDLQHVLNSNEGKAQTIINLCLSIMKNVCAMAVSDHYITYDPSYNLIKPKAKQITEKGSLTDEQVKKCFQVAQKHEYGLLIYILYYLGLRRNQALAIMWSDFDFTTNMVHIQRSLQMNAQQPYASTLKTRQSDRFIPIPQQLQQILKRQKKSGLYLFQCNGHLFTKSDYQVKWKSLMLRAGLLSQRKSEKGFIVYSYQITPHWFRHNYITMLYQAGVPAQVAMRLAGHSSYNITVGIYTHIQQQRIRSEAIKLQNVFCKTFAQPLQQTSSAQGAK